MRNIFIFVTHTLYISDYNQIPECGIKKKTYCQVCVTKHEKCAYTVYTHHQILEALNLLFQSMMVINHPGSQNLSKNLNENVLIL